MSDYGLKFSLVNETEGHIFSEWVEDLDDVYGVMLNDDGTPNMGAIYREAMSEYGRCQSKIYVDKVDGRVVPVGWYFVKRMQYEGGSDFYLRGAWVTVVSKRPDYQPREWGANVALV